MEIKIYKSNEYQNFAIVFYEGDKSILYAYLMDEPSLESFLTICKKGLKSNNLLSCETSEFHSRYYHILTVVS